MLEFLNSNSGAFSVLFSFIVTIATIIVAWSTYKYVKYTRSLTEETAKLRKVQTEPFISVTLVPAEHYLNSFSIEIENIGQASAYEISVVFEPDFIINRKGNLNNLSFVRKISYLKPRQKLKSHIGTWWQIEDNKDKEFLITANYKDVEGNSYKSQTNLDLKEITDMSQLGDEPVHAIANNIKKIAEELQRISTGSRIIKVETYSQEDLTMSARKEQIENKEFKDGVLYKKSSNETNPDEPTS